MSSIVTFYSYKGGVGRSMALANIAVLLAQRGLRVLTVDWDLEAPGLEQYFSYFVTKASGPGLLRLLMAARENASVDYRAFATQIDCGTTHPIVLLASGREQDDDYSLNLEAFDWSKFFAKGGGAFLERLREEWRKAFDIVLIDSRTGLSDTGGICTIQLPDIVVAMFTANHQSLFGVRDVLRLAQKARQSLAYDRMPLSILPLPSRWGIQEFQETQVWLDRVVDGVQEFYADWLPRSLSPRQIVEGIKIPHHSYFGFGERLAVVEQGITDPTGMAFTYDKIAAFLANDFKDLTPLIGEQAAREATAAASSPEVTAPPVTSSGYEFDVFVSYEGGSLRDWVIEFVDSLKAELALKGTEEPRIFMDTREIKIGSNWEEEIAKALLRSKVMLALVTPRYFHRGFAAAEFQTFRDRGRAGNPVLLPVILGGENSQFPRYFRVIKWLDMRDIPISSIFKTPRGRRPVQWRNKMTELVETLNEMIENAPKFNPKWTTSIPSGFPS
jgi:MinD-like ATPase involved in chromosome partitioning or flagellar assembly